MSQNSKKTRNCPHWSQTAQTCHMHDGGLYIPLDDFVENFCTTECFHDCCHLNDDSSAEKIAARNERIQETIPGIIS